MLGTSGWIQVPPRFHNADRIVLHRYGHDPETIDARLTGAGYTHELVEVSERVVGGHTESEIMPAGWAVLHHAGMRRYRAACSTNCRCPPRSAPPGPAAST